MWHPAPPPDQPPPRLEFQHGPVQLSVGPAATSDHLWLSISLTLGKHSGAPREECLRTWPTEAITLARQALKDLEGFIEANSWDPSH